jgi:hypothetical protein
MRASPSIALSELRAWLERAHGGCRLPRNRLPFGAPVLDVALPGCGLALGCLHEVIEAGPAAEYAATSTLFVAGILARLWGPVLWCLNGRDLFAPALWRVGLHPDRVIYCETWSDRDVLPAMEEGLRHSALAAVVGEVIRLPLTGSRRLQPAAEQSGVTAFVNRRWHNAAQRDLANQPSSAVTRWRISPSPLDPGHVLGLPRARWRLELIRVRGGEPVTSTRVDNIAQAVRVGLSRPNREPQHLAKLLSERLVLIDPGFGVELAALTASRVEALTERQTVGRHVEPDGSDLGSLIDTLGVRLGTERVYRLAPVESELPERSVRKLPALHPAAGADWPRHLPRPARILAPPERVTAVAEMPDHPPRLFVWRKRRHRVRRADGPERILGEWWKSESEIELTRDYFRVETADGARFWLFRDDAANDGRWWLHGIGDA